MFVRGDVVVDDVRQRVGVVMDLANRTGRGPVLVLRPPRGGREWEVAAEYCRPPEPHEVVSTDALRSVESP